MKPSIGIFGLSGCWGEQIVILNCEDQLLQLANEVDLADFRAASSAESGDAPLAIAFVEGSVGSSVDEATLRRIRARATLLVACGSCACFGGVAATDPATHAERLALVYGSSAASCDSRPHRPLSDFVKVDLAIPGCPMEKDEFLQAVACLVNGDRPQRPVYPVCAECRMAEHECLLDQGVPCVGPVTAAGCHARCPGFNVACIGCRGPVEEANFEAMSAILARMGLRDEDIRRRLHMFAPQPSGAGRELRS
jgi:coenzyme F420-reducing hydrogenase gamma subunit